MTLMYCHWHDDTDPDMMTLMQWYHSGEKHIGDINVTKIT